MMREMVPQRVLLVLMVAFLLGGSSPARAMHESGSCGLSSPGDPFGHKEFIDIGQQFLVRNVRIARHSDGVAVAGEIYNGLQGFFTPPLFNATLFDSDCTYLGANNFSIDNFKFGTTRPFRAIVPGVDFTEVATYHIEYRGWPGN
ncbi:MAG: hypothetical protein ACE5JQ_10050 [Candidatus Methylomirabilales bacterium]